MSRNPIHQLMVQNTKSVTDANGVLSQLWRLFLYETAIKAQVWDMMLMDYIERSKEVVDAKTANNWKSNLPKDLAREQISWDAFCQGLEVLDFKECKIYVELEKGDKKNEFIIDLVQKFGEYEYNNYLSETYDAISKAYPELYDAYEALWEDYSDKLKRLGKELPLYVKHNLFSSLNSSTSLTWNSFYRGLAIYNFDVVRFSIEFITRGKETRVTTLEIS